MDFKKRENLLGALAVLCLVLFAGDRLILTPLIEGWGERAARIQELTRTLDKGKILIKQEAAWKQRWKEMEAMALPEEESEAQSQVLKSMNQWARESRLDLTSLRSNWSVEKNETKRLQVRAMGQGSMEEIARFLYKLETAPTPLALDSIDISSRGEERGSLSLNFRATAPLKLEVAPEVQRGTRSRGSRGR